MGMIPYISKHVYREGDLVCLRFATKYRFEDIRVSDVMIVVSYYSPVACECFSSRTNRTHVVMIDDLMKVS